MFLNFVSDIVKQTTQMSMPFCSEHAFYWWFFFVCTCFDCWPVL